MSDKIDTLIELCDLLDLDTLETERLIRYLEDSLPTVSPFIPGDTVKTHNGKGYVHKTNGNTVLVRYNDIQYEEWLDSDNVTVRPLDLGEDTKGPFTFGKVVLYGDSKGTIERINNNYCLVKFHQSSESKWISSKYLEKV